MNRTQIAGGAATSGRSAAAIRSGRRAAAAIRPVSPADEAVLRDFFAALSVESRYLRFFAPVTPACGLLDLMAGKPAHVDAIIAVADGQIVGHAMAADRPAPGAPGDPGTPREPGEPGEARATDVGVVVADAWQRRGVGAELMRALIDRAQARGVTSLAMDVLPGNRRVLAMITGHWPEAAIGRAADSVDVRIPLPATPPRRRTPGPGYRTPGPGYRAPGPGPRAGRPAVRPLAQPVSAAVGKPLAVAGR